MRPSKTSQAAFAASSWFYILPICVCSRGTRTNIIGKLNYTEQTEKSLVNWWSMLNMTVWFLKVFSRRVALNLLQQLQAKNNSKNILLIVWNIFKENKIDCTFSAGFCWTVYFFLSFSLCEAKNIHLQYVKTSLPVVH